ncbi:MAG: ribonuclease HII [Actinobacteria bacterium]|nr:ribonuclease HII [Actinomycetota bacterium]
MKVIERALFEAGISPIAGVDEAGRGACAGPLLVASVMLKDPFAPELTPIRDSKELSESKREELFDLIQEHALAISVIEIPSQEVDARGVHAANLDGMRRAVQALEISPRYVLTDGYEIPGLGVPALAVWKGDQVVLSISAASIIAKVSRDRIMCNLDGRYPGYGFSQHKGYITAAHTRALRALGPCLEHRRSFSNIAELANIGKLSTN